MPNYKSYFMQVDHKENIKKISSRSQRRKWIQCFDKVNAVIFVAALSDYLLKLDEDHNVNRMIETLRVRPTNIQILIKIRIFFKSIGFSRCDHN